MKSQIQVMSIAELMALPVSVDLVTGARAFGVARTKAYELARAGQFPVPLLRVGNAYRVRRADLLALLGVTPVSTPSVAETGGSSAA